MKIEDICYLSGLFDADGCASSHIAKKKNTNYTIKVHSCEISMTNKEVIYWVKNTVGFGNIYYSSDESHLVAVRDNSSDVVWQNEELQYRDLTAPKTISNYVAVADFEGYLHLISQIDGRIIGRTRIDNDGVRSNLIVEDGSLIVYGNGGSLVSLTIE